MGPDYFFFVLSGLDPAYFPVEQMYRLTVGGHPGHTGYLDHRPAGPVGGTPKGHPPYLGGANVDGDVPRPAGVVPDMLGHSAAYQGLVEAHVGSRLMDGSYFHLLTSSEVFLKCRCHGNLAYYALEILHTLCVVFSRTSPAREGLPAP